METWHIHIKGQVQGVGFRPFVFVLANEYGLNGWVNNTLDGVHIVFNAEEKLAAQFREYLISRAPKNSCITSIHICKIQHCEFDDFQIKNSQSEGERILLLTPDFGLCEDCRAELHKTEDRRYSYPFITCTLCGPRYSIIDKLPYDRSNTSMDAFEICQSCQHEYRDPTDRRYHSQTNSCSKCGIQLRLFDRKQREILGDTEKLLDRIPRYWSAGKIIAIKGIGGYLLTCDASNQKAVETLRTRKHRPSKPLALMHPKLADLGAVVELNTLEADELKNHISPIVLLNMKDSTMVPDNIAPGLNRVGFMLPYTPLFDLLLQTFGRAIVATSGNISSSPIIYQDEKAIRKLARIADYILVNNREIIVPQDDSVIKYSYFSKQKIILRRARGLAPTYINAQLEMTPDSVLAMGAMNKSTFSLLHHSNTLVSQYLGDLIHFDTLQNYRHTIGHFLKLFDTQPEIILVDKHGEYPSSDFGERLSKEWDIPIKSIQHHIAHFSAVLGENNLVHSQSQILGVIWDGTGLGDDGQIWGGEFFQYHNYDFLRCHHYEYFNHMLGDKMAREPRISALSACWNITGAKAILREKFNTEEWKIYSKLLAKKGPLQTSSVGRIFDAVASILGIMDKQSYEGEAAMRLEALASSCFKKYGLDFSSSYLEGPIPTGRIPLKSFMADIILDLQKGEPKAVIAAKFHLTLVKIIEHVANNLKIKIIAFSGGVFQNGVLIDLITHHLGLSHELYFHQQLPPNDECVSFGQLVSFQIEKHKKASIRHKYTEHVFSDPG